METKVISDIIYETTGNAHACPGVGSSDIVTCDAGLDVFSIDTTYVAGLGVFSIDTVTCVAGPDVFSITHR